jgi:hypothetical protein
VNDSCQTLQANILPGECTEHFSRGRKIIPEYLI